MARPSDISSKPMATRVPMEDYIKFLKEATENKMCVSDFLLMKLYAKPTAKFEEGGNIAEADALKKEVKALKLSLTTVETERDKWKKDWKFRKRKFDELEIKFKKAQEEGSNQEQTKADYDKLATELKEAQVEGDKLKKKIEAALLLCKKTPKWLVIEDVDVEKHIKQFVAPIYEKLS